MPRPPLPLLVILTALSGCGDDSQEATRGADGGPGDGNSGVMSPSEPPGPPNQVEGLVAEAPMDALSSVAQYSPDLPDLDRAFVGVSIGDWEQTCPMDSACPGAAVNLTFYVLGGTRDDVKPGLYTVDGAERDGLVHQVVGGAGRYDDECTTGGGFASLVGGAATVQEVGSRVKGTFTFNLDDGEVITGHFDALACDDSDL
jgi:hypothetical protein